MKIYIIIILLLILKYVNYHLFYNNYTSKINLIIYKIYIEVLCC